MQTFTLTGTTSLLRAHYHPPIDLTSEEKSYSLGLISFETYNAIPNIDEGNNKFYIGDKIITIPTGSYELHDINSFISNEIEKLNKEDVNFKAVCHISANNNTLKCHIKCSKSIDFTKSHSINSLLGFENKILKENIAHVSDLPVNILKVNSIRVECNITTGAYNNNQLVHTLHEFFPSVPPGFKIIEVPQNVLYMPINTRIISEIVLKIVDQDGNDINFRKEVITIRLHLKRSE